MKSITLNKKIRDDILDSIMDQWRKDNPAPNAIEAQHFFAEWLWNRHYGKFVDVLEKLPEDMLYQSDTLKYQYQGKVNAVRLKEKRPSKAYNYYSPPVLEVFDVGKEPRQLKKYLEVQEKNADWSKAYCSLESECKTILSSVRTTKQLLEIWPQVEPFFPAYLADPSQGVALPALPISRLNERLGITE